MRCPVCGAEIPPEPFDVFEKHWARHDTVLGLDNGRAVHRWLRRDGSDAYLKSCRRMDLVARRAQIRRAANRVWNSLEIEELPDMYWDGEDLHNFDQEDKDWFNYEADV